MLRQLLPRFDTIIVTCFQNNPRHVPVESLVQLASGLHDQPLHVAPDPSTAWKLARRFARPDDLICITGSFFIAAELRDVVAESSLRAEPLTQTDPCSACPGKSDDSQVIDEIDP
jgi:dihydrofolate synthase/folylpolyglutamate synthase